jgi:transcription elongation GreA/GreB family factor
MTINNCKSLMTELTEIKIKLFGICKDLVTQKIADIRDLLNEVQEAANNETKSSAGDKHETGRAMAQLETEKLSTQLADALKLAQTLSKINPKSTHQLIGLGSLVITSNGNFYISVSLGKIEIDNKTYFSISNASPIGKLLLTKKEKDSFSFNNKTYVIENIV